MFQRCVVVCSSGVDIACSGVVGMAKQGMSHGDDKGGQFGAHGYIIRGKGPGYYPGRDSRPKLGL